MKKYQIITFGCQANVADSERIARKLEMSGHKKTEKPGKANIVVINACSVRQKAIDRVYGQIKNLKGRKIILAGCVPEEDKKKLKDKVNEIWHPEEYFDLTPIYSNAFVANIPIMTGCDNFCTYCVVPYSRNREYSRPVKDIVKEVKNLVKKGYKEIWLLGQNVNSYKDDEIDFPKLLRLVNKIPGDFWIRFTSPHPKDFSEDLIKAMKECKKFAHYLNLPLQSGDNKILKKMGRPYTITHYKNLVKKIRKAIPDIAISTDIIVGFPGETKKEFENTCKVFKEIGFGMAFISEYSPRPGTASAKTMKDNVPHKEKECRKKILNDILIKTALKNNKKLIGKTVKVLNNRTAGNKLVEISGKYPKDNFLNIKITKATPWHLEAKLL